MTGAYSSPSTSTSKKFVFFALGILAACIAATGGAAAWTTTAQPPSPHRRRPKTARTTHQENDSRSRSSLAEPPVTTAATVKKKKKKAIASAAFIAALTVVSGGGCAAMAAATDSAALFDASCAKCHWDGTTFGGEKKSLRAGELKKNFGGDDLSADRIQAYLQSEMPHRIMPLKDAGLKADDDFLAVAQLVVDRASKDLWKE